MCLFACVCVCRGLQAEQSVLLTHGDSIDDIAKGFQVIARSDNFVTGE